MDDFLPIYLVTVAISLVVLYVIIRYAVKHGTTGALRAHELWMRDGSLEAAMDKHAERREQEAQQAAAMRLGREPLQR